MKTQNTVAKRLAKLPHIISLPEPLPEPPELKRLIEARLVEVSSEQSHLDFRNEDQALEFAVNKCVLAILEHHLTDLCAESPEVNQPLASPEPSKFSGPTKINFSQTTGSSGSDIPPQPHPTGSQVGPGGSDPVRGGSDPVDSVLLAPPFASFERRRLPASPSNFGRLCSGPCCFSEDVF